MKFEAFLQHYSGNAIIDSSSFALLDEKLADLRRQVSGWVKKGYLIQLKKGIYILSDIYRKVEPSRLFLANYLVSPSYLSLEYALGYYDLIPEMVTVFTSLTTKKTQKFNNELGAFAYHSVKKELFFGFTKAVSEKQDFYIALPEKAILDFFYLRKDVIGNSGEFEAFRFQNLEIIKLRRLREFLKAYPRRVQKAGRVFADFVKKEAKAYTKIR